jgi:hypothetical protein
LSPSPACSASQTHDEHMLSDTTLGSLVRTQGQIIRQAEQLEVTTLLQRDDLTTLALQVVRHDQPRRRAGWPKELNAAVDMALAAEQVCPPEGLSWADWDRVLAARRAQNAGPVEDPPPGASPGSAPGAAHHRRSAGAASQKPGTFFFAHGADYERTRLWLPEWNGHSIPSTPAASAALGSGTTQLAAGTRLSSALSP